MINSVAKLNRELATPNGKVKPYRESPKNNKNHILQNYINGRPKLINVSNIVEENQDEGLACESDSM
jgi:hypothetical protein